MSSLEKLKDPCWLRIPHLLCTDFIELFLMFVKRESPKGFSLRRGKSQAAHQVRPRDGWGRTLVEWES